MNRFISVLLVVLVATEIESLECEAFDTVGSFLSVPSLKNYVSPYLLLRLNYLHTSLSDTSELSLFVRQTLNSDLEEIVLTSSCSVTTQQYLYFNLSTVLSYTDVPQKSVIMNNGVQDLCVSGSMINGGLITVIPTISSTAFVKGVSVNRCVQLSTGLVDEAVPCWNMNDMVSAVSNHGCACDVGSHPLDPDTNGRCEECPTGTQDRYMNGDECLICTAGRYESGGQCYDCGQGFYSESDYSTTCQQCIPGTFGNSSTQDTEDDCFPCEGGTFSPNYSSSQCTKCTEGKYSLSGFSVCANCSLGVSSVEGSFACDFCTSGKYNDVEGSSACKSCPANAASPSVSISLSQCYCPEGFYGSAFSGSSCYRCPNIDDDIFCASNVTYPNVGDGFLFLNFPDPKSLVSCIPAEACTQLESGETVCSDGYEGDLCGQCKSGFYQLGNFCNKCPPTSWTLIFVLIFAFLVFCTFIVRASVPQGSKAHSVGIWLSWVQILSLYTALPAEWPPQIQTLFQITSFANFNIELFSPGCSTDISFWGIWYTKLLFPFIFAAGLSFVYCIHSSLRFFFPKSRSIMASTLPEIYKWIKTGQIANLKRKDPNFKTRYIYAFVMTITYVYTTIASTPVTPLNCVKKDNGEWRMLYNQDVKCYEGYWVESVLPSVIFFSVLYMVGVPLALYMILRRYRDRLHQPQFLNYFGGLTLPYREKYEWFEIANMGRKATMAVMVDFCSILQTSYLQLFATLGIAFVFLLTQFYMAPYKLPFNNHLSFVWIAVSIFCLFAGLIFVNPDLQHFEVTFFTVLVCSLFGLACALSLGTLWEELVYYYEMDSDKTVFEKKKQKQIDELNEKRVGLLQLFPRSHQDLLTHISLLNVNSQKEFFQDCDDLQNTDPENLKIYSNPLLNPEDPEYEEFSAYSISQPSTLRNDDSTLKVKVSSPRPALADSMFDIGE